MSKKGGNFFEEHIEKMVLAIVGLVCVWLLITRILISPNAISYDNDKFSSGDIDDYISRQAGILEDKLNRKPEPPPGYEPRLDDFSALLDLAISDIDVSVGLPQPVHSSGQAGVKKRAYRLPQIGEVNEVSVEHLRAVAYVPVEEIDEENTYDQAEVGPNDIDFVTVQAKFDVARLVESFYESFAGRNVQEQWRDPCLARPVFAAVQMRRQQLLPDGTWGGWQRVPRTRIDARRAMFEVIEEVNDLPAGGIKVRMIRFAEGQSQMGLLQPAAYQIASAKQEWFPPSLHKEFAKYRSQMEARQKREQRVAAREELKKEREKARASRRSRAPRIRMPGGTDEDEDEGDSGDHRVSRRSSTRRDRGERRVEKERPAKGREAPKTASASDIYDKFDEILLTKESDFIRTRQPLVFWAHDDTVEPERCYRYRIRLGVFNPIAGTEQFSEQDRHLKNKVVLWSEFSDTTEPVEIPGMLYFFPCEIAEARRAVTVQVCRYVLGYWYCNDFMVKPGEVIGKVTKSETSQPEEAAVVPERIDYTTGAVLVDVAPVNDFSAGKNPRARRYFDMLYSSDGADIERMPIKSRYWGEELQSRFAEIKKSEKAPREPLREKGSRMAELRRDVPGQEYEE